VYKFDEQLRGAAILR